MLTVAVLGPVELRRDGVLLPVPAGRPSELLVRLALDAGTPVRAERLIEDLWEREAATTGRNTLQSKVSIVRRALGDPALIAAGEHGYVLAVDPRGIDALEVVRLDRVVGSLRDAGDAEAVAKASAQALAMFRGEILPGCDATWLEPHRARLHDARLRLTEEHLAARVDQGAGGELVGDLEALVGEHPLRERLWALLITVLYRAGRQADALAVYRRVRQHLAEELGLDPGPQLQALEQQILQHDRGLEPAAPDPRPQPAGGNLPAVTQSLIGRDDDVAVLSGLVREHRLVTLVGPAGVGKTRLAVETASRLAPQGGWLVRLEQATSDASLWPNLGEAFGISEATEPMVTDRLRGPGTLLVLDGCEHLVQVLPPVITRLLGAAPGLRVLATSQLPLGIDGEHAYQLQPLTAADSVTLFTERAARQRSSFGADADHDLIEAVCRSLDGLPLAIELAAARVKVLSVQEIARRLGDRFALLRDPSSRRPARQRALRDAIAWSYDLLFPDDQRGLWALACFRGGAPLAATEAVTAALGVPGAVTVDVLDRLADRSLVQVAVGADGAVRYHLLDSVREFGAEQADGAGVTDLARSAHAAWFAATAAQVGQDVRGPQQAERLSLVRTERANIDAALDWARRHDRLLALRIATGFAWAWAILGAGPDAAQRVRDCVAGAASDAAAQDRATGLLLAGWLEATGGDLDVAEADLAAGISTGDADLGSIGRLYLAFVRSQQGQAHDALDLLERCRRDFDRAGLEWELGASWLLSAWAHIALGDIQQGRAACERALHLLAPLGDQWALNHAEGMLGALAQAEHRFADATEHLRRAAAATNALGFAAAEAHHLANLGRAEQQAGAARAAAATLQQSQEVARRAGDPRTAALAGVRLGRVLRALGEPQPARTAVDQADTWYRAAGGGEGGVLAQYLLAVLDLDDGEPAALSRLEAALAAALEAREVDVEVLARDALARGYAQSARPADAVAMLAAADAAMVGAGHLLVPADRADGDLARRALERQH